MSKFTRPGIRRMVYGGLLSAVVVAGYGLSSVAAPARGATPSPLVVGIAYVVPPFIGGAKVRTPDAIDTALVDAVSETMGVTAETLQIPAGSSTGFLEGAKATVVLDTAKQGQQPAQGMVSIPVGYPIKPRAIMRTDTDIKRWEQLAGRTVCLSEGGLYAGEMAKRYGAIEQIYPAPADSLLALRTGGCDAAVHDDVMLAELLRLPEWKKFSASLTTTDTRQLRFLVPASQPDLAATLKRITAQWKKQNLLGKLNQARVRDIAFEVYLDQEVTDCH